MTRYLLGLVAAGAVVTALGAQQPPAQQPPAPSSQPAPPPAQDPQAQPPAGSARPSFAAGPTRSASTSPCSTRKAIPSRTLTREISRSARTACCRTIDNLKMVSASGAAPDDDTSLPIRSPYHAAAEAARDDIRVFVIFWDEYHIGEMGPGDSRPRRRSTTSCSSAFGPTDLVALMDQLTPTDAIRFTRDRRELAEQVHKLRGRQGVYFPPRSAVEEAQMYRARDVEMLRAQVTATALESTIAFLGSIKEGRKSILFVSQTIGRVGATSMDTFTWLVERHPAGQRQQHLDLRLRSARPRHEHPAIGHPAQSG